MIKYFLILLFSVAALGGGLGPADYVRLVPHALPSTCNSGDLRVGPAPDYLLQICRTNSWDDVGFQNPMTTNGDLITQTAGVPDRIGVGGSGEVLKSNGSAWSPGKIVDANVDSAAAISYSKLNLSTSITNNDISPTAAIEYSKLELGNFITNSDIFSAADIDYSKLASLTTGRVLISDGSGKVSASSTTDTTLGFLDIGSSLTTLLSGKQATGNYITALTGDASASGPGSVSLTLATVNTNTGSWGSVTQVPIFTVNGKGLITAASQSTITPAVGSITGLGTGVGTFLATPSSSNLKSAVTDETGSGALCFADTPTFVTPLLGTPTSGNLANCTGYPLAQLTGAGSGVLTWAATPSSLNLKSAITDETGSGALCFADTPTFVTPLLGTPTSGNLANCTGYPLAQLTGAGSNVLTFLATASSANLRSALTDETGSGGAAVFATGPTISEPTIDDVILDGQASAPSNPSAGNYKVYINDATPTKISIQNSSGGITLIGSGGGGGSAIWNAVAGTSPTEDFENGEKVWRFTTTGAGTDKLTLFIKVPSTYAPGSQINVRIGEYSPSTSNTILMTGTCYLIRNGTDAVSSTTNSRVSTNTALTNSVTANKLRVETLDCSSSTGTINSVAVSANDAIRMDLVRGSDSDTADIRFVPSLTEITFQ